MPRSIEIACPFCGVRNRAWIWLNLNAIANSAEVEDALNGKLFSIECQRCEEEIPLEHSLHFHDPEGKSYFRFEGPPGGLQARAEELANGGSEYSLRRASDFSSLLELLNIWKAGLDNAPMLLMKHMLAAEVEQCTGTPPLICNFSHLDRSATEPSLEFVVVEAEESEAQNAGVPFSLYNVLMENLGSSRDRVFPLGVWVDWDSVTAKRALEAMGGKFPK